ncbi:MAG: hypothetical protein ACFBSF_18245 [Leptolyngbyaceae cyanobacterium]
MTQAFVGVNSSPLDQDGLQALMQHCGGEKSWHFLRWPHKVKLEFGQPHSVDFDCTEGQVFNQDCELRWKRKEDNYEVLVLATDFFADQALKRLGEMWTTQDLSCDFFLPTETRLPKGITYPKGFDVKQRHFGQRYFINDATGTVHFIALRAL